MSLQAKIKLLGEIGLIDERLYGSFIEHMGRAVYTGIYEPAHASANEEGFRQDVAELIRGLNPSVIRYPGGNFVSGYAWEDGVGPRMERPIKPELAWGAIETNQIGTNEFMDYLRLVGAKPMLAVNLGTRGAQDAVNLLEYCNFVSGTYYSDLRVKHGYTEPHGAKLWCLGNEMDGSWQICAKTAEEYGRLACETAKMMRMLDPGIELVVCGSSFREMPSFGDWERTVLKHTYEYADYLSLHTYYQNNSGDVQSFLANNVRMDRFIKEVVAICDEMKKTLNSDKDINLSFDEWNVWYHYQKDCKPPEKWIEARPIEEEIYDFADALLVGSMLTTLINNSDRVKIACLAQLVNTIAPIMTEPGGRAWAQTTYYPFMYTSMNGRGIAQKLELNSPTYSCDVGEDIPYIDCAAVSSDEELTFFIVNKHLNEDIEVTITGLTQMGYLEHTALNGYSLNQSNTADDAPVKPVLMSGASVEHGALRITLSSSSWNMVRVKK